MKHITKEKGDLATIKAMSDLTSKGYVILSPVVSEHLPFDFIAYKDNKSYRIQSKYSGNGFIRNKTSWNDKRGNHKKPYGANDFDYYAIYLPQIDKLIYPSIKFGGTTISDRMRNSSTEFYWWEDFMEFTDIATKRSYREFGYKLINIGQENIFLHNKKRADNIDGYKDSCVEKEKIIYSSAGGWNRGLEFLDMRKVKRPSREELGKLLWDKPTVQLAKEFGVTDKAIEKWAKSYGLSKPPRGYWAKLKVNMQ